MIENLKNIREKKGKSLRKVAEEAGVYGVFDIEHGNTDPTMSTLLKLLDYYDCTIKSAFDISVSVGAGIWAKRRETGKTLWEVAKDVGIAVNSLSKIENNQTSVKLSTFEKLSEYFGKEVTINEN